MRLYKQRSKTLRKLKELDNREDLNIVELELKKAIKEITDVDFSFFEMDFSLTSQSITFFRSSKTPITLLNNLNIN